MSSIGRQHVTKVWAPYALEPTAKSIREGDIGWERVSIAAKHIVKEEFPDEVDKLVFVGVDIHSVGDFIETQWSWVWAG